MSQLTYNDVRGIFREGEVWSEGREEYWYQRAWAILGKENLTQYSNDYELCVVKLYAITFIYVFRRFCEIAFDDYYDMDLTSLTCDIFSDFEIGQIFSKMFPDENMLDENEINDALMAIVEKLKFKLYKAIGYHMNPNEVYAWMYCTVFTPSKLETGCEDDSKMLEIVEYDIGSYPEYENMLQEKSVIDAVINDANPGKFEAFDYINSLM